MIGYIVGAAFLALAAACIIWGAFVIRKLVRLNGRFKHAIVLIPLYKKYKWQWVMPILMGGCLIADIVYLSIAEGASDYMVGAALLVIIVMMSVIMAMMMLTKCAVLDSGIVVPYRFIEWTELYDYKIEDSTIFFMGDANGFDTLGAATTKLTFDVANAEKLQFILEKHKKR